MTIEEMKQDYDWIEAWKHGIKPLATIGYIGSCDPVSMEDVKDIIASEAGENDGSEWIGIFLLRNGKYLFLKAGCDYTGWDCRSGGDSWLSDSLEDIISFGLGENDRSRLRNQLVKQ